MYTLKTAMRSNPKRNVGFPNQHFGTSKSDILRGLEQYENEMWGYGGDDIIYGNIRADRIWGGSGDDLIYGYDGNDWIDGGKGDDQIYGGRGNDVIFGREDNDFLAGGEDDDQLWGGSGDDTIRSGQGSNQISGGPGIDLLDYDDVTAPLRLDLYRGVCTGFGSSSVEYIENVRGGSGNDTIFGDGGKNELRGNLGDDDITGGDGDDTLVGGPGNDDLYGDTGDDTLEGGDGDDTLAGGIGIDTADYSGIKANLILDLFEAKFVGAGTDTLKDIENLIGGDGNDWIVGDGANNRLDGKSGFDTIIGGWGNDTIVGAQEPHLMNHKQLYGGGDNDQRGEFYFDVVDYSKYTDFYKKGLYVSLREEKASPIEPSLGNYGGWFDLLSGFEGVVGSKYGDLLAGDQRDNRLLGGQGDDTLRGHEGNDTLDGGEGHDSYYWNRGDGNDVIRMSFRSNGTDTLVFGPGILQSHLRPGHLLDGRPVLFIDGPDSGQIVFENGSIEDIKIVLTNEKNELKPLDWNDDVFDAIAMKELFPNGSVFDDIAERDYALAMESINKQLASQFRSSFSAEHLDQMLDPNADFEALMAAYRQFEDLRNGRGFITPEMLEGVARGFVDSAAFLANMSAAAAAQLGALAGDLLGLDGLSDLSKGILSRAKENAQKNVDAVFLDLMMAAGTASKEQAADALNLFALVSEFERARQGDMSAVAKLAPLKGLVSQIDNFVLNSKGAVPQSLRFGPNGEIEAAGAIVPTGLNPALLPRVEIVIDATAINTIKLESFFGSKFFGWKDTEILRFGYAGEYVGGKWKSGLLFSNNSFGTLEYANPSPRFPTTVESGSTTFKDITLNFSDFSVDWYHSFGVNMKEQFSTRPLLEIPRAIKEGFF
jgi:Ca2+-binding RTX toxin-like protein